MEYEPKFYSDYDLENYYEYEVVGNMMIVDGIKYKIYSATKDGFWLLVPKDSK